MKKLGLGFLELNEHLERGMNADWLPILEGYAKIIEKWMPGKGWRVEPALDLGENRYIDISSCVKISTELPLTDKEDEKWWSHYSDLEIPEHTLNCRSQIKKPTLEKIFEFIQRKNAEERAEHMASRSMSVDKLVAMADANDSEIAILNPCQHWEITNQSHPAYCECLDILRLATHAHHQTSVAEKHCSFINSIGEMKFKITHCANPGVSNELHVSVEVYEIDRFKLNRIKHYIVLWCALHYESQSFTWLAFDPAKKDKGKVQFSFKEQSQIS